MFKDELNYGVEFNTLITQSVAFGIFLASVPVSLLASVIW